jgi:hypothetical protein
MTMGSHRKIMSIVLVFVFLTSLVSIQPNVKAQPKEITVPDDYPTIQEAVGNASSGDTVFVKRGIYYAPYFNVIVIDKSISLIGEDASNTVIDGIDRGEYSIGHYVITWDMITLCASNATISGFTIRNGNHAIVNGGSYPSGNRILGNSLSNNKVPIAWGGSNFLIEGNNITDNDEAMNVGGMNGLISNNTISGLAIYGQNMTVCENRILNKGLSIGQSDNIVIYENNITNSLQGITFSWGVHNTTVRNNNIINNSIGISLDNFAYVSPNNIGKRNNIYLNNIVNNTQNAFVKPDYPYNISMIDNAIGNGTDVVSWDNGTIGNYWGDYNGSGTYVIDENNIDHYPLTKPIEISTIAPTPSPFQPNETLIPPIAIAVSTLALIIISLLLYRRRRKPSYV